MTLQRLPSLICILFSILLERGLCNCPVYGCTLFHSFTTPTQFFNSSFKPELLWKFKHPELRPTGAGCVTNGGRILCPMVYNEQERSILTSWDALSNGRLSWNITLDKADLPLPVVDVSGDVLASNGYKLLGFMPDGKPFGKPISLYPIHGQIMDLSISSGQFLILLYKCGFFVVYITNGIPHASIWLNDTINSLKGTFIPLNTPAVNSSSSDRLYVLTVFRSRQQPQNNSSHDMNMRLYAFDVTGNMAYRIQTVWYYDFILPSASIPYLGSQETVCNVSYPPGTGSMDPAEQKKSANLTDLPAHVVVQGDVILVALNYIDIKSGDSHCRLLAVANLEKSYSINYSKDIDQECYGIAYNSQDSALYTNNASPPNQMKVWLHVFDPVVHDSSLLLTDMHSGDVVMNLNLSALLGKDKVKITSQMLIAYLYLGNDTLNRSPTQKVLKKTPIPLIFGVTDGSGEGNVVAIDLSLDNMKVIWTIPVIVGQSVSGQICTVDRLQDSLLVFTDQSGVYFFKIS